jgi:hypothetical protein
MGTIANAQARAISSGNSTDARLQTAEAPHGSGEMPSMPLGWPENLDGRNVLCLVRLLIHYAPDEPDVILRR